MEQLDLLAPKNSAAPTEVSPLSAQTIAPPQFESQDAEDADTELLSRAVTAEILGERMGRTISMLFASMEVAEEEIVRAQSLQPEKSDALYNSFRFLSLSDALQSAPEELYRIHAREMLERVANDVPLEPGTDAELLAVIKELTLRAPPSREVVLLYMDLFAKRFPDFAASIAQNTGAITPDEYEEARMQELEAELRRKLSTERDCHKVSL
jgi:hypothetical protein